ncbi:MULTISPECIES: ROK family transcriptional regulator [unclassified Bacillus (in: firmicutes)]|uniref:ROK family transcriptional regulator n=1 Tax=unclassified Bacillus (in: firmicutes) TaxID=185979 RepID=UPI00112205FE|nr:MULTISPECIES: ROK family transcriptional regulator [unclassified Bacillus (in: firmicutes)]
MKWNQQTIKINNKLKILESIRDNAPISRADLAQKLGLTKGTVSTLVNELLEANICYETGPGESSGGRRPVMLLFQHSAAHVIGIDIGVNYILGVLTDLNGNIIKELKQPAMNPNYDEAVQIINELIRSLLTSAPASTYGVVGIGLAVPGMVNIDGELLLAPNLDWKQKQLKNQIQDEFNLPVIIENEANAGAFAEKKIGPGQSSNNTVYISAGIGIGVGMILNGELYRGSNGFAGEMGHMIIQYDGLPCSCGSKGCWELYASEKALIKKASTLLPSNEEWTLEKLIEQAENNKQIQAIFTETAKYLGIGIASIANTLNPEQIIIGNRLAMAKDLLKNEVEHVVGECALDASKSQLQIQFSNLSIYSAALGVSAFAVENFIQMVCKQSKVNL